MGPISPAAIPSGMGAGGTAGNGTGRTAADGTATGRIPTGGTGWPLAGRDCL